MFDLCGCGRDSIDEKEDSRQQQQKAKQKQMRAQQQGQEQLQMPPSEGELAPEFSAAPEGLEPQECGGVSQSNVSMKTANYGGTLEQEAGSSTCSRKRSIDSADVIHHHPAGARLYAGAFGAPGVPGAPGASIPGALDVPGAPAFPGAPGLPGAGPAPEAEAVFHGEASPGAVPRAGALAGAGAVRGGKAPVRGARAGADINTGGEDRAHVDVRATANYGPALTAIASVVSASSEQRRMSSSSIGTSSSVCIQNSHIFRKEGRDSLQCSCPMYEVDVRRRRDTVRDQDEVRSDIRALQSTKSVNDKIGLQVVTTETVTRRQYTYNVDVDLPPGMRISPRGRLVQDQGASAEESRFDKPMYCDPQGTIPSYAQSVYPPPDCVPNAVQLTDCPKSTVLQSFPESVPGYCATNVVVQPQLALQQFSPQTYVPQEQPTKPTRHSLSFSASKTEIMFHCACVTDITRRDTRRASTTQYKSEEFQGLIQAEFECVRCRRLKTYVVCKVCYKANKIRYCKDCKSQSTLSQESAICVRAVVSSTENIPRQAKQRANQYSRRGYDQKSAVKVQQIFQQATQATYPPGIQPQAVQAKPMQSQYGQNQYAASYAYQPQTGAREAQTGQTVISVCCRSQTQLHNSNSNGAVPEQGYPLGAGYLASPVPGYTAPPSPVLQGVPLPGYAGAPAQGYQAAPVPGYKGQPAEVLQTLLQAQYQKQPSSVYQVQPPSGYQPPPFQHSPASCHSLDHPENDGDPTNGTQQNVSTGIVLGLELKQRAKRINSCTPTSTSTTTDCTVAMSPNSGRCVNQSSGSRSNKSKKNGTKGGNKTGNKSNAKNNRECRI